MARILNPLFDRVVVQVDTVRAAIAEKYTGLAKIDFQVTKGIEDQQIPDEGVIVAVGASCEAVEVGQRVLFGKWAAKEIAFQAGCYVMVEADLIGIITEVPDEVAAKLAAKIKVA